MSLSSLSRCAFVGTLFAFTAVAQANSYTVVDLGAERYPVQINSHGWIAGQHPHGASQSAIVYRGEHWRRLSAPGEDAYALAINASGDVVGIGGAASVATLWPRGGESQAVALPPGAIGGTPLGIANDDTIAGYYVDAAFETHCFRTTPDGASIDLGFPGHGDFCQATAINRQGWIAGSATHRAHGVMRAFLWKEGVFHDLGALSSADPYSYASAVNNSGHVVGCSHIADSAHAFLWDGTSLLDIGVSDRYALTTCAYGISGKGDIVGVGVDADALQHAVRFAGGAVITLADEVVDPGDWVFYTADSVNSDGVIVGTGALAGEDHGFMLVPQAAR